MCEKVYPNCACRVTTVSSNFLLLFRNADTCCWGGRGFARCLGCAPLSSPPPVRDRPTCRFVLHDRIVKCDREPGHRYNKTAHSFHYFASREDNNDHETHASKQSCLHFSRVLGVKFVTHVPDLEGYFRFLAAWTDFVSFPAFLLRPIIAKSRVIFFGS